MASFEDNLLFSFTEEETPSANVDFLSKPENYVGGDLHSIRLQLYAKQRNLAQDVGPANANEHHPKIVKASQSNSFSTGKHLPAKKVNNARKISLELRGLTELKEEAKDDATDNLRSPNNDANQDSSSQASSGRRISRRLSDSGLLRMVHRESLQHEARQLQNKRNSIYYDISLRFKRQNIYASRHSAPYLTSYLISDSINKFRRVARLVIIVQRWIVSKAGRELKELHSQKSEDLDALENEKKTVTTSDKDLSFDVSLFKADKEITLSTEVKNILRSPAAERTREQVRMVVYSLQHIKSFSVYPLHMQESLIKVASYQRVPPKRVIIRQGHIAESFYFILTGTAEATIMDRNPQTGETSERFASLMKKGTSFGELALLYHSRRTATVSSGDKPVELLVIDREDFFDIFMRGHQPGEIPEHIQFISTLKFMEHWPITQLIQKPQYCLLHFFTRNTVITKNGAQSEWIYIIKSGSCKVITELKTVIPKLGLKKDNLMYDVIIQNSLGLQHTDSKIDTGKPKPIQKRPWGNKSSSNDDRLEHQQNNKSITNTPSALKAGRQENATVSVQLQILKPKDVFGLQYVIFNNQVQDTPLMAASLVSNGAECVMLSKKFFMDYATADCRRNLADIVISYPPLNSLQHNLQTATDWLLYKKTLMNELTRVTSAEKSLIAQNRISASTGRPHSAPHHLSAKSNGLTTLHRSKLNTNRFI